MSALKALFTRECRIAARLGGGSAVGLIFFLILVTLLPFAIGPDLNLLARVGPALLWISALLATLLGLDRLLQADEEDGSLDLLTMSRTPLELIVAVKCLAHWLMTGVPLIVATPFFGLMLAMEPAPICRLMVSLLVGTPALTLLGMIGAALTATISSSGVRLIVKRSSEPSSSSAWSRRSRPSRVASSAEIQSRAGPIRASKLRSGPMANGRSVTRIKKKISPTALPPPNRAAMRHSRVNSALRALMTRPRATMCASGRGAGHRGWRR